MHPDPGQERADDVLVDGGSWVPPAHAQAAVKRGPGWSLEQQQKSLGLRAQEQTWGWDKKR